MSEYNLKAVLRQTGLTPETLRAWERRYGAVRPKRTEAGRRVYTSAEVYRLTLLGTLVRRGFRIGGIAKLTEAQLTKRLEQFKELPSQTTGKVMDRGVADVIQALDDFDLTELKLKIANVRFRMSPKEFALDMVPAVMYRVGALIDEKRFTIAEEHALSQLILSELKSIYNSLEPLDSQLIPQKRFVFATREGDYHEIGIMLAALICRSHGIHCQYLGANYPAVSLAKSAKALKANAVIMGLSFLPTNEERVSPRDYLNALNKELATSTEIWAGGSGLKSLKFLKTKRQTWYFESLADLEKKMNVLAKR